MNLKGNVEDTRGIEEGRGKGGDNANTVLIYEILKHRKFKLTIN